ncbi:UDP-4-amino-4,6-dideoxy-N-acetyl-beta-L-altrosamine transaminase [Desulfosarcina sp.]|nr:UDP-4-amino-4,6-dideoxy-N-acetyl-beta-L-altrosamine transaminase [Desulfosarcina sp.]
MIPYGRQSISEEDIQAVVEVLRSDYLTQGPTVSRFEESICCYTGSSYGVATNSGTSALHLACLALELGAGDYLWTSPITFVASANCALYCGAKIDFVDIDPCTFNISIDALTKKLKRAELEGTLPKIIVPVHMGGLSCDMSAIHELSLQYGFHVIEDACHALGGKYKGKPIGNCHYSDISVFSFHPVKIITTGEGGMAVTNESRLMEKMALLSSHGITRDVEKMKNVSDGPWYYQQIALGYNYRMTDIQASLGISQAARIDSFVEQRHKLAKLYSDFLAEIPVKPQHCPDDSYSAMHLYIVRVSGNNLKKTHKQIFEEMRNSGIGVNIHYIPVHTQPWYRDMGFKCSDFPASVSYYEEALSLPMFPDMREDNVYEAVEALKKIVLSS